MESLILILIFTLALCAFNVYASEADNTDDGAIFYNLTVDIQAELNMDLESDITLSGIHLIRVPKASSTSMSQVSDVDVRGGLSLFIVAILLI